MTVWAVVELLLVKWGFEVLVQGHEFIKETVAKIALVSFNNAIPRPLSGLVVSSARPCEQLLRDDPIGVTASDSLIELVTVQRCLGARAVL